MHPKTETPQPGYGTETFEMLVRQNPEYKHTNVDRSMNLFVFFFLLFQRMSALQELQLLEIMCSCFQEQSRDTVRQLMFSALFSLQGNQADESRMALLGKLVSMAIAVGRVPILECAATWLQVRIQTLKMCVLILINTFMV